MKDGTLRLFSTLSSLPFGKKIQVRYEGEFVIIVRDGRETAIPAKDVDRVKTW